MKELFSLDPKKKKVLYRAYDGSLRWKVSDFDIYELNDQEWARYPYCFLREWDERHRRFVRCRTKITSDGDQIYHILRDHIGIEPNFSYMVRGFLEAKCRQ